MYQDFFKLTALPFSLTPNPNFFCRLKGHQDALNTLIFSIQNGEGFIKIIGEVGTGKTLLCRKLLENLESEYVTAYIPNPDLSPLELRKAFARELGLNPAQSQDQHELLTVISLALISLHTQGKKVVLIIDEAQALTDDSLETVRLLTNFETESSKLLQVVLFGQPELDERLNKPHLRQLKQRITFSYVLPFMSRDDLDIYLNHRLATAGYTHSNLFTKRARSLLFRSSRGIPRLVNILSHKSLLVAYGRGTQEIDHKAVRVAVNDTEAAFSKRKFYLTIAAGIAASIVLLTVLTIFMRDAI